MRISKGQRVFFLSLESLIICNFGAQLRERQPINAGYLFSWFLMEFSHFTALWVAYSYFPALLLNSILTLVFKDGRAARLTNGMDFRAELCGLNRLKGLDYLYFFQPTIDINVRQCVSSCPNTSVAHFISFSFNETFTKGTPICLYNNTSPVTDTPYCYTQLQSTASGRNCIPVEPVNREVVNNYLATMNYQITRTAGDISLVTHHIGICFEWLGLDARYSWSGVDNEHITLCILFLADEERPSG